MKRPTVWDVAMFWAFAISVGLLATVKFNLAPRYDDPWNVILSAFGIVELIVAIHVVYMAIVMSYLWRTRR